jgi:anthranilate synthase component 2
MILVVDNYDSFAYNLVQYVGEFADEVVVRRNDEIDVAGVRDLDPDGIVVSPGPGTPADAGVSVPVFRDLSYPTLGVCLGHQALCAALGAPVGHAPDEGVADPFEVGRYHSLAVAAADLPDELDVTARTTDDRRVVMGVERADRPHLGVQYHPESILTDAGKRVVENFCNSYAGV